FNTYSAITERQLLPVHTNSTDFRCVVLSISSFVITPSLDMIGSCPHTSTTVEPFPIDDDPPSIAKSTKPSKSRNASSQVDGGGLPSLLADGAAMAHCDSCTSFRAIK